MENKKISYITLTSDLFLLLGFSYIIYGFFFGFERIGHASFTLFNITDNVALILCIIEILFSIILSYMLHKCNIKKIRVSIMILCILNIIYRVANITILPSIFSGFILLVGIILLLNLILY